MEIINNNDVQINGFDLSNIDDISFSNGLRLSGKSNSGSQSVSISCWDEMQPTARVVALMAKFIATYLDNPTSNYIYTKVYRTPDLHEELKRLSIAMNAYDEKRVAEQAETV